MSDGDAAEIPTSGPRVGAGAISGFFETLGQTERITRFEPREFFVNGNDVMVLGYEELEAIPTGNAVSTNWTMLFRFRGELVSHWEMFLDTAAMAKAYES